MAVAVAAEATAVAVMVGAVVGGVLVDEETAGAAGAAVLRGLSLLAFQDLRVSSTTSLR